MTTDQNSPSPDSFWANSNPTAADPTPAEPTAPKPPAPQAAPEPTASAPTAPGYSAQSAKPPYQGLYPAASQAGSPTTPQSSYPSSGYPAFPQTSNPPAAQSPYPSSYPATSAPNPPYQAPTAASTPAATPPYQAPSSATAPAPNTPYRAPAAPSYPAATPSAGQTNPYQSAPQPYQAPGQSWGQTPQLQPYYAEAPAIAKPRKTMGIVGMAVVAICAVVGCYSGYAFGFYYAEVVKLIGLTSVAAGDIPEEYLFEMTGIMAPGIIATLAGIVGFVVSIIAATKNKGRVFAVVGIILGVIAPILMFILTMAPMMSVMG